MHPGGSAVFTKSTDGTGNKSPKTGNGGFLIKLIPLNPVERTHFLFRPGFKIHYRFPIIPWVGLGGGGGGGVF
jgi:hypothetical protein